MKKIILSVLLLILAGFSIFSFRKISNKCLKTTFSDILDLEYIYVNNNSKSDITLIFSKDGRIFGFAGVNRYFAGYRLEGENKITFSPIGSTMMAGSADKMDFERKYFDLLKNVNSIKLCKDRITLITSDDKVLDFIKSDKGNMSYLDTDENIDSEVLGPKIEERELKK